MLCCFLFVSLAFWVSRKRFVYLLVCELLLRVPHRPRFSVYRFRRSRFLGRKDIPGARFLPRDGPPLSFLETRLRRCSEHKQGAYSLQKQKKKKMRKAMLQRCVPILDPIFCLHFSFLGGVLINVGTRYYRGNHEVEIALIVAYRLRYTLREQLSSLFSERHPYRARLMSTDSFLRFWRFTKSLH